VFSFRLACLARRSVDGLLQATRQVVALSSDRLQVDAQLFVLRFEC
jgi:hypothetical protein